MILIDVFPNQTTNQNLGMCFVGLTVKKVYETKKNECSYRFAAWLFFEKWAQT